MAFNVQFKMVDEFGRKTTRTWGCTEATVALVLTALAVIAPLLDAITQGGLTGVNISTKDESDAFAFSSPSNVDENASITVIGGDTFNYDFDLPMPIASLRLSGGKIDVDDAAVVSFFAQFLTGGKWRINLRNPTDIVTVVEGKLDK